MVKGGLGALSKGKVSVLYPKHLLFANLPRLIQLYKLFVLFISRKRSIQDNRYSREIGKATVRNGERICE